MSAQTVLREISDAGEEYWVAEALAAGVVGPISGVRIQRLIIAASTAETNTLKDPSMPGQLLILTCTSLGAGGTRAITYATGYDAAGDTVITFGNTRDTAILFSVPDKSGGSATGYRWELVLADGLQGVSNLLAFTNAVSAAGTTQGTATPLTPGISNVTTATSLQGVNLPASNPGEAVTVINNTAVAIVVYAQQGSSDTINGVVAANGVQLYAGSVATFYCTAAGAWEVCPETAVEAAINTNSTAGAITITAAQITGADSSVDLALTGAQAGGVNATLPTVANLVKAMQCPNVGSSYRLRIINEGSTQTITVVTAAGWTLTGTMTIANNTWREFVLQLTSLTAATLTSVAVGTYS